MTTAAPDPRLATARPVTPASSGSAAALNPAQRRAFATDGYVLLRDVLDTGLCAEAIDALWPKLPPSFDRADPSTWTGDAEDSCVVASVATRRGHMKFKSPGDPLLRRITAEEPRLRAAVAALLGDDLAEPYFRGLYPIFPVTGPLVDRAALDAAMGPELAAAAAGLDLDVPPSMPHVEAHAVQLVAVCYFGHVPPGGGGLLVWPGSHRALWPTFTSKLDFEATEAYAAELAAWSRLAPRRIDGCAGDVILMHHRLFHAPSVNRLPGHARYAAFCDFARADMETQRRQPPGPDMWEDWPGIAPGMAGPCAPGQTTAERSFLLDHPEARSRLHALTRDPRRGDRSILSRIVRQRRRGEVWLLAATSDRFFDSDRFEIRSEAFDGVRIALDGVPVTSDLSAGCIAPVPAGPGTHRVSVESDGAPVYLRLLRIGESFSDIRVVARVAHPAGTGRTEQEIVLPPV